MKFFTKLSFLTLLASAAAQQSTSVPTMSLGDEDVGSIADAFFEGLTPDLISSFAQEAKSEVPIAPTLASVYGKYYTASGFKGLQSALATKLANYVTTQTIFPSGSGFPTDEAQASTDPKVKALATQFVSIITELIATETSVPSQVKASMKADLGIESSANAPPLAKMVVGSAVAVAAVVGAVVVL